LRGLPGQGVPYGGTVYQVKHDPLCDPHDRGGLLTALDDHGLTRSQHSSGGKLGVYVVHLNFAPYTGHGRTVFIKNGNYEVGSAWPGKNRGNGRRGIDCVGRWGIGLPESLDEAYNTVRYLADERDRATLFSECCDAESARASHGNVAIVRSNTPHPKFAV
jgi:hypothetical protein